MGVGANGLRRSWRTAERNTALGAAAIVALLSATARPAEKGLVWLMQIGLPHGVAEMTLHVAPVVGAGVLVWGMVRVSAYLKFFLWQLLLIGFGGLLCGKGLAFCLDLFAASGDTMKAWLGPVEEARPVHLVGWIGTMLCMSCGMAVLSVRMFGRRALEVLAARPVSAAQAHISKAERPNFTRAGMAMIMTGASLGALTLLDQLPVAPEAVRAVLGAGFVLAGTLLGYLQWAIFRGMDELERRATTEAYAFSGIVATAGLAAAAASAPFDLLPRFGAYELLLGFLFLQTVGSVIVATKRMAQPHCPEEGGA